MTAPEVELRAVWHRVAGPHHDLAMHRLLGRLREPHRRYHNATHVMWVLRHLTDAIDAVEALGADALATLDVPALQWAALFHDAVYDPTVSGNEAASADLAVAEAVELGWPPDRCDTVHRLIMATAHHRPAVLDEQVLTDADLAILGADPTDYAAYVQGVRAEYAHLTPDEWHRGRSAVLRTLLDADPLFHTPAMRAAHQARARANMTAELAALG